MSEGVYYRGTLKEVTKLQGETLEALCKRILEDRKIKLDSHYTTSKEQLIDDCYDEYIPHEDILYSIERESVNLYDDIFKINKGKDGVLRFELKYYDGRCGFNEALEEAFNNITHR
ncbi:hypothetical protein [Clostridium estertheticum]|uniref:hypothetical protein n=1 Tax=Clostridium estertheticum TaxID=238834 RepID=UPI001C0C9764|nr:hypothetical protein [Clostridium estertheticum]MBU3186579.1 hypothetical protein [Clostridium estertheticum]